MLVTDAVERVKQADQRALSAQLAFVAGKWDEYWESQANEAAKRIEELYGNTRPDTTSASS